MKKLLHYLFLTILIPFTLLGIYGFFIMLFDLDIVNIIFYLAWVSIGCVCTVFVVKNLKKINSNTSSAKNVSHEVQNSVQQETIECIPDFECRDAQLRDYSDQKRPVFPDSYIVLDVETPNELNNRISQIGLLLIENGKISSNYSTLINPEVKFSYVNQKITGIDYSMVINAPKFNDYWNSIKNLFNNYIVLAHNANFDLTVLCKTLSFYNLELPDLNYICTYQESLKHFPNLKKHSLSFLAEHFSITQEKAHDAEFDAIVCHQIFEHMKSMHYNFIPSHYDVSFDQDEIFELREIERDEYAVSDENVIDLPFCNDFDFIFTNKRFVLTGVFTQKS